ncbi:MAG: AMP-binding protein [Gemmataceae bacterium]|nr:AMP-binding protein [Gemmataceae bacterium]
MSYSELDALARRGAALLQSLGVEPGDRVVVCTANKLAFLIGHLATLYAGGISLPLNPRFTREELRFFLGDSGARVALVDDSVRPVVDSLQPELPELRAVIPDVAIVDTPLGVYREPAIAASDPCLIVYSSGTTGWPKGIVHTHANVASSLVALQRCWRFTPDDVVLNVLPLFHIHGLSFATQLTLMTGGCVILDDFHPHETLERLADCTIFMAVPTIYYRFLEEPTFRDAARTWSKVRLFTCGSAPIRAEVLPELEAILGRPVINRYGMTEAFVITSLPLDGPWPCGSVGLPLDGVEVRVMMEDRAAEPGEVGAVQLRGPNLFREYWRQPEATRAAFASGWFDTGDLGSRDAAGFLTLVGRKHDLIITSGFNVYPQVVERVINSCPGVRESAVVGVADARKGERVAAAVVRDDQTLDEDQLRMFWNERLVDYQRPRDILFVDALPRNALGKVLRRALRDRIEQST